MDLSLVLPCYREGPEFPAKIVELCEWLSAQAWKSEVWLVDDGGSERARIESIPKEIGGMPVFREFLPKNGGRGGAVKAGISRACGEWTGFLDVDLEVHYRFLLETMERLSAADGVVGKRSYPAQDHRPERVFYSRLYRGFARKSLRLPVEDPECGYKFFHRQRFLPVIAQVRDTGWFFDTELVYRAAKAGLRWAEQPVLYQRDPQKISTVAPLRDGTRSVSKMLQLRWQEGPCR